MRSCFFSGNNRGQPLTAVNINTPIKGRLRPRNPEVKYGEDITPPKTRIVAKTAMKRKRSNAKSSNATKKPTVAKRRGIRSRGKGSRPSRQGVKHSMTKEGSAAIKKGLKSKRKFGILIKSLCNKKKAKAPASLSEEFPEIKICKDVAEWAANKKKECVGMIVHNHPAFMKWMGKTDFYSFVHLMKKLGFTPKHKKWHWNGGSGKKEVKEGRKGMLWYHPTFGPNSSDADLTTDDRSY